MITSAPCCCPHGYMLGGLIQITCSPATICVFVHIIPSIGGSDKVRTALENPRKPWNLNIKIQALENPGILTLALESPGKYVTLDFIKNFSKFW